MSGWSQDKFNATLREYLSVTSRTIAEAINTKAFFIARRAVVNTKKADKQAIKALGDSGKVIGRIINKRRGARGEKGLWGKEMAEAVKLVLVARIKSIGYLKSGWIPAIKKLEKSVSPKYRSGAAKRDPSAKVVGRDKGSAIPATNGFSPRAQIENAIGSFGDRKEFHRKAIEEYGRPALQDAFDFETKSMREYLDGKMKPDAAKFNAKQR